MDLRVVMRLGEELLAQHGLTGWHLTLDHARRRAGACRFESRTISLSRHLMALYDEAHVRDTVLHEIAHALVGPRHGHDATWRSTARQIGCSGSRLVATDAPRTPAPWLGTCPRGHTSERHRRPARPTSCARCSPRFDVDNLLRWTFHGREVPMGARYERELRELGVGREGRRLAEVSPVPRAAESLPVERADVPALAEALPFEIAEPPVSPRARLAAAAASGALTPGWRVRIIASGKYRSREGVVVKSARTRYHVRAGRELLTVPFALVEVLEAPGA
ncbi:MAG: SprT-like domain-containing protein [Georgenia sp.]